MGCTYSRPHGDSNRRVFKVQYVNEQLRSLTPGRLEITDSELVRPGKKRASDRWPLQCLRRYGYDEEIFSFESGRRCPTGAGVHTFRCPQAELVFNLLQGCINRATQEPPQRPPYLEPTQVSVSSRTVPSEQTVNHQNSSNGVMVHMRESPLMSTSVPPAPITTSNPPVRHTYVNENGVNGVEPRMAGDDQWDYMNADLPRNGRPTNERTRSLDDLTPQADGEASRHSSKDSLAKVVLQLPVTRDTMYVNVNRPLASSDILVRRKASLQLERLYTNVSRPVSMQVSPVVNRASSSVSRHVVPPPPRHQQTFGMNYAQLDLRNCTNSLVEGGSSHGPHPSSPVTLSASNPESPRHTESYASIDFNKTMALSALSVPARNGNDGGTRKTRISSTAD